MNLTWSRKILESLAEQGVSEFVFCAGARNSPLVFALDRARGIQAYSFFEERSASFFAMGLARASGRPVAVITTSGTAVAELLPAMIEAFHIGVPLIAVTADRPRRLRGTGAPQAIDQTGIFAKFIEREFDLELGEMAGFDGWTRRAPLHINVCFDEPLIDETLVEYTLAPRETETFAGRSRAVTAVSEAKGDRSAEPVAALTEFVTARDDLFVLVGTLETARERQSTAAFLRALKAPTYLEATSGLREDPTLAEFALRSGDKALPLALRRFGCKRVLRLGAVPTARVWRDLDDPKIDVQSLSLSSLPFAGLSRGQFFAVDLAAVLEIARERASARRSPHAETADLATSPARRLLAFDREASLGLEQLFKDEPLAEPSLFRALSETIAPDALTYVGNSLPIREWDLSAAYSCSHIVEANRGVNGIDGQISTFLGMAAPAGKAAPEAWCIVGDLTAMYDLAAPWAHTQRPLANATVVVVNNGGGQIFRRIFANALFENRHAFDFANWAAQWHWPYEKWTRVPSNTRANDGAPVPANGPRIVELVPDAEATQRFWDRYDAIFA